MISDCCLFCFILFPVEMMPSRAGYFTVRAMTSEAMTEAALTIVEIFDRL